MGSVGSLGGMQTRIRRDDRTRASTAFGWARSIERKSDMGQQSIRQAARRAALEAQAQRRKERADRDKRIEALVVDVLAALEEGKGAMAECERRAGRALHTMTQLEGLTLSEATEWCRPYLTTRNTRRLVDLGAEAADESTSEGMG